MFVKFSNEFLISIFRLTLISILSFTMKYESSLFISYNVFPTNEFNISLILCDRCGLLSLYRINWIGYFTWSTKIFWLTFDSLASRYLATWNCVKSVRIRSYSGPYFPTFGLNMERYRVSLRIQSKCGKIRTRITPITDTLYAVCYSDLLFQPSWQKLSP